MRRVVKLTKLLATGSSDNVRRRFCITLKAQQNKVNKFHARSLGAKAESREHDGWYNAEIDLVGMFRDRHREDLNGPEYTESLIVHELAHGSAQYSDMRVLTDPKRLAPIQPRRGHVVRHDTFNNGRIESKSTGNFLEEAFAEQVRAKYVTDVLGLPHGFAQLAHDTVGGRNTQSGMAWEMPPKYVHEADAHGGLGLTETSFAGAALDLLIAKDPDLFPALIKARHDVDGLREVAQRINAIRPGLYKELRDNYNSEGEFLEGYLHVVETLTGRNPPHAESSETTPTKRFRRLKKLGAWLFRRR